jgi:hypothetical protein
MAFGGKYPDMEVTVLEMLGKTEELRLNIFLIYLLSLGGASILRNKVSTRICMRTNQQTPAYILPGP